MLYLGPKSLNGIICLAVYIHKDVKVKLRKDLISPEFNALWFEANLPNQKKLVSQVYREWQCLGLADSDSVKNNSLDGRNTLIIGKQPSALAWKWSVWEIIILITATGQILIFLIHVKHIN